MDVTDTQIDSEFAGGAGETKPLFAEDIFNQAVQHFGTEPDPVGSKNVPSTEEQDDNEPNTEANIAEEGATDTQQTEGSTPTEPEFKPYSFKGKVFGSEVNQEFSSPEELNRVISRGLAAETLHKRWKASQDTIQSLQADAESGREFESFAKENPEALLDLVIEKYMDDERAMNKVLQLFEQYRAVAKMTPEEREHRRKLKVADQLIREKEAAETAKRQLEERNAQVRIEQQKVEDKNWANQELNRYANRFRNLDQSVIRQQILSVYDRMKLSRQQGVPMSSQQASNLLAQYMKPFEKLANPAQVKQKLGEAVNQKKAESANQLANAARQQIGRESVAGSKTTGPIESADIFDLLKQKVAAGQVTLRP